jgi:pyruvate dehydrogenase E2 component (dihydrolipoamide acetyltransferase)
MQDMINSTTPLSTPEMERAVATGVQTALLAAEEGLSSQRHTLAKSGLELLESTAQEPVAKARAELAIAPAQDLVDVTIPQLGASSRQGTLVHWCKSVGDWISGGEVLFTFSTDELDEEIPSPASGYLLAIFVNEGETVPVGTFVASIGPPEE